MVVIEVHLNGERLAVAGVNDKGFVNAWLNTVCSEGWMGGDLRVLGMDSGAKKSEKGSTWVQRNDLKVGDEVTLRIVDVAEVDTPLRLEPVPRLPFWDRVHLFLRS